MNKTGNIIINTVLCIVAVPVFFYFGIEGVGWLFSLLPGDDDGSPVIDALLWLFSGICGVVLGGLGIYLFHLAKRKAEKKQRQRLFGKHEEL